MPNLATPKLKDIARLLLAYEAAADQQPSANSSAAFRVCEKLSLPLGKLLGTDGFRALLSRALVLARTEVPWLSILHIQADGTLELQDEEPDKPTRDARAVAMGEVALVAQLLGLLLTFIGPALTLRLVHDIWPKLDDLKL